MRTRRFQLQSNGVIQELHPQPAKNIKPLPVNAVDLVRELDVMIPARCIGAAETPVDAHRYAGQRELVEHLLSRLADTNDLTRPVMRST